MARVSGDLIGGLLGSIDDMIGADSGVGWGKPLNGNRPEMQNLMAPQPVSDKTPESEHRYWVEKSADGETLGKALLKRHFGFESGDIVAYEAKYGKFLINDKRDCEVTKDCSTATKTDIDGWMTKNGEVAIDLKPETVKRLRDFRNGRIIDSATGKIVDPELRRTVATNLKTLTNGTAEERAEAARTLADMEAATFDDAEAVRNAIRTTAANPLNKQNATLHILSAKTDLDRAIADKVNAFDSFVNTAGDKNNVHYQALRKKVDEYERRLQNAADAAGGIDTATGKRLPYAKIDRAEAARVNQELSEIYEQMNQSEKALERRIIARYYTLTDKDRNSPDFRMGKPRVDLFGTITPGVRSGFISRYHSDEMTAGIGNPPPTVSPKAQPQRKDPAEDPRKLETRQIEKRYKIVEQRDFGKPHFEKGTIRGYERVLMVEGSLREEFVRTEKFVESKTERRKKEPQAIQIRRKTTVAENQRGPELNATGLRGLGPTGKDRLAGMGWGKVAGGAGGAVDIFNNNFPLAVDLITDRSRIQRLKQEKLEKAIFLRDNYPIPPEPIDLPRIKLRLEKDLGKQKASEIMKTLEEMSYAAYGK